MPENNPKNEVGVNYTPLPCPWHTYDHRHLIIAITQPFHHVEGRLRDFNIIHCENRLKKPAHSPFGIQFFDLVKSVLAQLDVFGCRATAFVFISRNVHSMSFKVAQTITSHHDIRASSFNQLDTPVICSRTIFATMPTIAE